MAETAIVYKNVADGLDTVEESTDSIISTMMAYGIAADDTMSIIDRFNAVGNNFAITSAGIGEAMQRSASALKEGGNTIDESIGLITGANAVIQDPLQVGTALKTLSLRIRGVKTELEEAGLETEGMAETTSQLQAKLNALTHGKVDIMLNADEFKSTTQILREMSAAWEDMTDIERAASLELMGGKRQANILSSLISNFEIVEDVIETSMKSSGSAMEENAKWLDSIEGKTYQFTNALETMWSNMIDSEVVKSVIEFGTKLIQFLDTTPGKITAVVAALAGIAKFKGLSILGLGQDAIRNLNNVKAAYTSLSALSQMNPVSASMPTASIQAYSAAVSNLTAKQQANMLASQGLSKAQIQLAMQYNGLSDDVIREATAHVFAKQAKDQENMSEQQLLASKIMLSAASLKLKGDTDSLAVAEYLEANASKLAAAADAEQIIMASSLTAAQKAAAVAAIQQSSANYALGTSFKALFASNPVGLILTIATTILSFALPAISKLHKSTEELTQAADEAISKYKESQSTLKEQKKTIDELSDSYEKLSKGVDVDTNENIGLTTQSYQEYLDICNDIADMYPNLVAGFDAQGNAILSLKGNVDELVRAYKDAAQASRQELITKRDDIFKTFKNNYSNQADYIWEKNGLSPQINLAQQILDVINSGDKNAMKDIYWNVLSKNDSLLLRDMYESVGIKEGDFINWWTQDADVDALINVIGPKILSFIKSTTGKINTETNKVKSLMSAYLGEDLDYVSYSEKTRAYINKIVSGLSAEFINGFDNADALYNWIKTNIVDAFKDQSVVDAISGLSKLQLEFTNGDINYEDYKKKLNEYLSNIQNKFDEESLAQIKIGIGIDEESLHATENYIAKIVNGLDAEGNIIQDVRDKINSLTTKDLQIAGQLEVPEGTILSWDELTAKIEKAKIAAIHDFDITNFADSISAHSAAITEYQEALQKLGKGSFTMDDFMELIKKYPELAKGVDISSNAFHGLSRNLNGAIKTSTKNFIKQLKELKVGLVEAGKSTDSIDQLIEAIENMPDDALDGTIQKYSTLADKIDSARRAQDKLLSSMDENPNEGYETRGEAMEYMKEAMKKGEIGSESNLWNVAEKYGFTYDSAKTINENADALAKYIAIREKWFKTEDDGDNRTDDGYSYKGTESFIKDVESAVANSSDLQQYLTWDYDESTGTLNFDYNNEDWDTIISILSKTKELAGLTSDEFSDLMIQVGQYFGIEWGNYDDVLDHLNGIATGTSDAKTKVEEYGLAMQDYFGDDTDIDLTARPMVKFDSTNFAKWEKLYQEIINNPDGHSEADVKNAKEQLGSIQKGDSYATVYSSTFSNDDGTKSVVVTPILPDGTVLSPEQLEEYANKLLAGEELEPDINIKLAEFDGSDSIEKASKYAQALHEAQEEYDALRDTLSINTIIDDKGISGLAEIKELQSSILTRADGTVVIDEGVFRKALIGAEYTEDQIDLIIDKIKKINTEAFNIDPFKIDETLINKGVAGLEEIERVRDSLTKDESTGLTVFDTDMFTSVLKEAGYTKGQIEELIKKIQEYNNIVSISGNTDPLGLNNASLSVDSLKASLSTLGITFKDTLGTWFDGKRDLTIEVKDLVTTLKEKGWTDASIKEYITQLSNNTHLEGFNVKVKGIENIDEVIKTANEVPEEKITKYEVIGQGPAALTAMENRWAEITKDKTTNYTITETTIKKTEEDDGFNLFKPSTWFADGTAHAQGTAFSSGSWGAPRTETALTGELGPEILVRNGRWTTVGENGAEFTQVKKGDIIFNHKQSEQLLKNGYVTSRGKAYASGTAFAVGNGTFSRYEFSGTGGWQQYDVNDTVVESWGDLSGVINKAGDAADEFEEVFDWIEVRLEEINEQLDLMNAQLENAGGYVSKNSIIDQIIGVNTNKMANLMAGIKKYSDYTARLLADVPSQYRDAAQDGAIAITEFVGEADEKTVKAIDKYREWAQKVAELRQQLEETKQEIRDLAIEKIDNIQNYGSSKTSIEDLQTEKLQNIIDYYETKGEIPSSAYYGVNGGDAASSTGMFENSYKKIDYWTPLLADMQKKFNEAVEKGQIEVGSIEWYEQLEKLYQVQSEIDAAKIEIEEYQNAINDTYWKNFDEYINRLDYINNDTQNLIDLMSHEDMVAEPEKKKHTNGTVEFWTEDDVKWTDEGLASLGLYAQQMEIAEHKSKQYAEAIDNLTADYEDGLYSENEYLEKLNELKDGQYDSIEAYYDAQDAIKDLNETRIESIKEGIEKEIEAYEELIEKKKEELSTEKDLYDFQKSTIEQQKNISDIQRKLAALSNDNSTSAIAKRKKLEAELAEAKQELDDTYYDRSIEQRQNALDKELDDFTEEKNKEIEKWDEYLTQIEQVVADSLNIIQANAAQIGETLTGKTEEYNLAVSDAILSPWEDGALAVSDYQTTFDTAMSSTTDQLNALKNKWQEVIDKMVEAAKQDIIAKNQENANYAAARKSQEQTESSNTTTTQGSSSNSSNTSSTTGSETYTVKSGDTLSAIAKAKLGSASKWREIYNLNKDIIKNPDRIYPGQKLKLPKYGKGTTGVKNGQWSIIDELGLEEIVMHAGPNGKLAYLTKGSAVIPGDISENLMELGRLDPSDVLKRSTPKIEASPSIVNNTMEINMQIAEVVHIDNATTESIPDITKAVEKQLNSYMNQLNNAIKAKVR